MIKIAHLAGNTSAQKQYLYECGYSFNKLKRMNPKQVYKAYRKEERNKNTLFGAL